MPRDYARYINKTKRPLVERGWRKRLLLVGILLLLLASGFGIYLYQHNKAEDGSIVELWVKQAKSLFIKTRHEQNIALKQEVEHPEVNNAKQDTEIQFSFYTDLATMQVPASPAPSTQAVVENKIKFAVEKKPIEPPVEVSEVASTTNQTKVIPEKYLLQIAAFKNPSAAGEMRISLLLAGFEAEIVKAMQNDQQLYQLQQGPFSTIAEVKAMQRELKKKGIESVIVKKIT